MAPMQIGIRKVVKAISVSAMPSIPSAQLIDAAERDPLDELPLRPAGVEGGPHLDAEREVDQGRDQRDPARAPR